MCGDVPFGVRRPSGITRLFHLSSFALSSLPVLLTQRRWHPDVVITVAPAFFCAPGALLLGYLCGRCTTSWLHIQDFELDAAFELGLLKGKLLRHLAEAWERSTLQAFDRVSSISSAMVQRLEAKGVTPGRSLLLPNWVDLKLIRPQLGKAQLENSYRRELGIGSDQLVVMYSGSMNKKQGLELLAEVIHQLADLPHLVWLLAGEGPTKAELVEATKACRRCAICRCSPQSGSTIGSTPPTFTCCPRKQKLPIWCCPPSCLASLQAAGL